MPHHLLYNIYYGTILQMIRILKKKKSFDFQLSRIITALYQPQQW